MNPVIFLSSCFAVATISSYGAFANLRKARLIEDTPTSRIRSAHQGYVELMGVAEACTDQASIAPLTGTPCVWYHYRIERYQGGKRSRWVTVECESSEQAFVLRDATGWCRVEPADAEISTSLQRQWGGTQRHPLRSTTDTTLFGALLRRRYRYTEQTIISGQPLYIAGQFSTQHPSCPQAQREKVRRHILQGWKREPDALLKRFDTNGDGNITAPEWEVARNAAWREAETGIDTEYDRRPIHSVAKPTGRQPFLISTKEPRGMTRSYRGKSLLYLALTAVCITLAAALLSGYLSG